MYETAIGRGRADDLSLSMIEENERCCQVSAQTIADTVRVLWENQPPEVRTQMLPMTNLTPED
jgi:hypothetical protein